MVSNDVKSIRMIVNGKNAGDPPLKESLAWAGQQGHQIEVRVTPDEGDAARFAAERTEMPPETPLSWQ